MNSQLEYIQRLFDQGAFHEAAQLVQEGLQQNPELAELWLYQGRLARASEQEDVAIEAYQQALLLAPEQASWHSEFGQFLRQLNHPDALGHFEAARAFEAQNLAFNEQLIGEYLRLGNLQDALIYLGDILPQYPEEARLFALLGQALRYSGKLQDAENALKQSLFLDNRQIEALLALLELYFVSKNYDAAQTLILHLSHEFLSFQPAEYQAHYWHLNACVNYVQGQFLAARDAWRYSLNQIFNDAAFWGFNLALPLIFQRPEEEQQWLQALHESLEILQEYRLPNSLQSLPFCPAWHLPLSQRSQSNKQLGALWGDKTKLHRSSHLDLFIVLEDIQDPRQVDMALALLASPHPEGFRVRLGYFYAQNLASEFDAYAEACLQLPDHLAALELQLQSLQPESLLFLGMNATLFALAARRAAPHQIWAALKPESTAIKNMDYVLWGKDIHEKDWTETPLCLNQSPLFTRAQMANTAVQRMHWGLPRLGRLYCIVSDPQAWDFALDEQIDQIFQRDRKAFILGFQRPQTVIHTLLMQRHAQRFPSRYKRIRWFDIPLTDRSTFLRLVDVALEAPNQGDYWHCAQALAQGTPTLCVAGKTPRARQSLALCALGGQAVSPELLGETAVDTASSAERDMLKASEGSKLSQELWQRSLHTATELKAKIKEINKRNRHD